jgi:hypothetical protein
MLFLDVLFGMFVSYEYITFRNAYLEASAAQTESSVGLNRVVSAIRNVGSRQNDA